VRLSRRSEPFDSNDYIFELKIDGFRSLAYIENGQCDLVSRNGNTFRNFKDLAQWIGENLGVENAVIMARLPVSTSRADRCSMTCCSASASAYSSRSTCCF
jgi:hypothetical protein